MRKAFISVLIILTCKAGSCADELRLLGKPIQQAELIAITDSWQFTGENKSKRIAVDGNELIHWGSIKEIAGAPYALLSDGSIMMLSKQQSIVALQDRAVTVNSDIWGEVALPLDSVRAIVLKPPRRLSKSRLLINRLVEQENDRDELVAVTGDVLKGEVISIRDKQCELMVQTRLTIPLEQVSILKLDTRILASIGAEKKNALIGFRDGSLLVVRECRLTENTLALTLSAGPRLRSPGFTSPVEGRIVRYVKPLHSSKVLYLSDLSPNSYKHVPFLRLREKHAMDRNQAGGPLCVRSVVYPKGIAMPTASRMTFELGNHFSRFESEVAIDDSAEGNGSAIFRVFTKSASDWREDYASGVIRGRDEPKSISVSLDGARELSLVVDFADRAAVNDRPVWLDARLIRK